MMQDVLEKNDVDNAQDLIHLVKERENLCSTAIGNFIAVPHCRTQLVNKLSIKVFACNKFIKFHKDKSINIAFLIILPEEQKYHLKVLSKIARIARHKEKLQNAINYTETGILYSFLKDTDFQEENY